MKVFFLLIMSVLLFSLKTRAQNFWAKGSGGNNLDEAMDVTKDSSGNIISVGYFTSTSQFLTGPFTPINLTSISPGVSDVFIQKMNPSGDLLWVISAGGPGSDRPTAVKTDANGDIYITGFYYGTATFGSISLTSVGSSQDIFIAKLNSNGVFQWAVSAGGSQGDYSYGLALDQNNNLFITGQFEGTSTFGSQSLTSQVNLQTGLPSFDIFTAKYNSSGVFQWVQQGSAEYNDRGMDLVCDDSGNVYITGQFSDTITFQNTYFNGIVNAIFVIKYNAAGQEVWFRKAAGAYGIGYAINLYNNQDLYLCGDYKGPLTFFGSPNNFLNDAYTNRIFLAKYTTSGDFIWAQSDASDNALSAKALAFSSTGDIYVAGEFGCVMNEYSNLYGAGVFNSVGYSDIFTSKYTSAGNRTWERHFGGQGTDKVWGIVEGQSGRPIIAGSFEQRINWPIGSGLNQFWPGLSSGPSYVNTTGYCNDSDYGSFGVVIGNGLSDAFVCDAIELSRQPYDFFYRSGPNCDRPQYDVCIATPVQTYCPDTIKLCYPGDIRAKIDQSDWGFAPLYNYNWSPGQNGPNPDCYAFNSGNYSVTATSVDGCYVKQDTVYVMVNVVQPPTITDNQGVNFNQLPSTQVINVCAPDTVILTGGNVGSYSCHWDPNTGPGIIASHDSVLVVNASGTYHFRVTAPNGCMSANMVTVYVHPNSLILPRSNMPDTFRVCEGSSFKYTLYDSITNPNGIIPYPDCFWSYHEIWTSTPNLPGSGGNNSCGLSHVFYPIQSGTYILQDAITIQNTCGAQVYGFTDTIYVIVEPKPLLNLTLTGPSSLCPGNTAQLTANTTAPVMWNTGSTTPSITINTPGFYGVTATILDSITGCENTQTLQMFIGVKPIPILSTLPTTAIICPNDSVQIFIDIPNAINYEWHGPMGINSQNAESIYVSLPGFYYCIITDADGCELTSNTTEIKQYSTPYLIGQPANAICSGQTTNIVATTDISSSIQWLAPLSGSSPTQTISAAGTYSCQITSCGITTNCNIEIVESSLTAIATASGPTEFCPGDSVILSANAGLDSYTWAPTSFTGDHYVVYDPGIYSVTVIDAYGCLATSNAIDVTLRDTSVNLGHDTIICDMDSYAINVGSGYMSYHWNTGSTNQTLPVDSTGDYWVTVTNLFGCSATDTVFILFSDCNISSPINVFTPNNDGVNDVFQVVDKGFKDVECVIFDRWGKKINEWKGKDGYWDGRNLEKESVSDGTYYYIGKALDIKGVLHDLKGFVFLSR